MVRPRFGGHVVARDLPSPVDLLSWLVLLLAGCPGPIAARPPRPRRGWPCSSIPRTPPPTTIWEACWRGKDACRRRSASFGRRYRSIRTFNGLSETFFSLKRCSTPARGSGKRLHASDHRYVWSRLALCPSSGVASRRPAGKERPRSTGHRTRVQESTREIRNSLWCSLGRPSSTRSANAD